MPKTGLDDKLTNAHELVPKLQLGNESCRSLEGMQCVP